MTRAVSTRDNGGGGANIHIIMFTYRKHNRFQKKSVEQSDVDDTTNPHFDSFFRVGSGLSIYRMAKLKMFLGSSL